MREMKVIWMKLLFKSNVKELWVPIMMLERKIKVLLVE
jgi:hypothetical protein